MVNSMTGFGRGSSSKDGKSFIIEIRTVNHRYNDIFIKMPREFASLEDRVRESVGKIISRGKTDVFVTYANNSVKSRTVALDKQLASLYISAFGEMRKEFGLKDDVSVSVLSRFPDVLKIEENEDDIEETWGIFSNALDESLGSLLAMRKSEGEKLEADIRTRIGNLRALLAAIEEHAPRVVPYYKQKLEQRIAEIMAQQIYDEARLAAEVALFADRCNIDEEITRLHSHLSQMDHILGQNEPIGRKIDFLMQEMNREINTIASKANFLQITNITLEFRSELEKMREQVQNIE